MGAVYLIRHGQASFGDNDYDKLSELGRVQAQRLGGYLAEKGLRLDAWRSGLLNRQIDTASIALNAMGSEAEVARRHGFNEFDHVAVLAKVLPELAQRDADAAAFVGGGSDRRRSFQKVFEKVIAAWLERDEWEDVDSWSIFSDRAVQTFESTLEELGGGRNIAIVTSGGVITAILQRVLGLSSSAAFSMNWSIVNASITKIMYSGGGRRSLAYFNNYSYLQCGRDRSYVTWR
ncbi:histidine phosphatase family protein [Hahella aquimaris]|uniref:histidine phosphatase family protein n=1 Tax=Hahella sp. HNIBRBA332 TaxID=3015983 RepID=UPI00273C37AA|nr:histidine phosphatase family protein [Hahella sp. HNIBRBA332]WLQ13472.1 histidine phosphatase family protein [Hahella sp. HNIBRBA332]